MCVNGYRGFPMLSSALPPVLRGTTWTLGTPGEANEVDLALDATHDPLNSSLSTRPDPTFSPNSTLINGG